MSSKVSIPNGKETYRHEWRTDVPILSEESPVVSSSKKDTFILRKIVKLLSDAFNVQIKVRPRKELVEFAPALWEPVILAAQLKKLNVISEVIKREVLSDEPKMHSYSVGVVGSRTSGQNGLGASFFSEEHALWAALGEALDRYSLVHFNPKKYIDASYSQVAHRALNIFSLAGVSSEIRQAGQNHYPLYFDETTVFRWVKGRSLTQNRHILIPLQLVTFYHWPRGHEPVLRIPVSTGNAVGRNLSEAVYRGVLEVIERDAFMITWLNKLSPPIIDLKSFKSQRIQQIIKTFERYNLELKIIALPTDAPRHVVLAVILDRVSKSVFFSLGMKVSHDLEEAIIGAVHEAQPTRLICRGSAPWERDEIPELSQVEKIGRLERIRIWTSRPDLESELAFLWAGTVHSASMLPQFPVPDSPDHGLESLLQHFKKDNKEVCYVENLPLEVKGKLPLTCAYVVIPELQPLHLDERLPYFSGDRLRSVPLKLGYKPLDNLNKTPHPFP